MLGGVATDLNVDLKPDGDGAWPDMVGVREGRLVAVGRLVGGMQSGRSSVTFKIELPDGEKILVQTSMRMFLALASGLRAAESRDGILEPGL